MNTKKVSLRFNTNATNDNPLKWRVIIDGIEHLASHVDINCKTYTTKDYIEGVGDKWHITCEPTQIIWEGDVVKLIGGYSKNLSRVRHMIKAISWRVVGTLDTMFVSTLISGDIKIGLSIGGTEVLTKMILYYFHERLWYRIPFGGNK